jgi:hypothetical protein
MGTMVFVQYWRFGHNPAKKLRRRRVPERKTGGNEQSKYRMPDTPLATTKLSSVASFDTDDIVSVSGVSVQKARALPTENGGFFF